MTKTIRLNDLQLVLLAAAAGRDNGCLVPRPETCGEDTTRVGKAIASLAMLLGYGIIAVPTGIVTMEISNSARKAVSTNSCPDCSAEGHDNDDDQRHSQ